MCIIRVLRMVFTQSLRKRREFKNVYDHKRSAGNRFLVVYIRPNGSSANLLGISANRKVGKAVVRNRIKRCIKEQYRMHEHHINKGYDIVVNVRPASGSIPRDECSHTLGHALWCALHAFSIVDRWQ